MLGETFTLDIRPTFVDELDRTVDYIERKLRNPEAADRLIADVYAAIDEMLDHPLVTAPVYREPDVAQPYYAIRVRDRSGRLLLRCLMRFRAGTQYRAEVAYDDRSAHRSYGK